ncbi:MAG: type II toxin-antitoxin system VapC family toxin [Leptolyngbyaceae cyanobacterium CSU_1_3]|nr:type II toxin-antitoxin system VapC family toxin [Leptolyngbyaceae cyanobacterium CSU_1_3]
MKPKVYVETSVISYLTSRPNRDLIIAGNQQITQEWWQKRRTKYELYVSQLVVREASLGDAKAAADRLEALREIPFIELTEEGKQLAEQLVNKGAIPLKVVEDALHIAIATSNGMEYLLTWNFKHIANAVMRGKIEAVCRDEGYEPPVICTPQELLGG